TQAEAWGGALDVIDIASLSTNSAPIEETLTGTEFKFNNVVASGDNLYFPITSYNRGAVVGRLPIGSTEMDTITVPGVSANAIAVSGLDLRVVTGYAGGFYTLPAAFNENSTVTEAIAYNEAFGGKYIAGDYVLRTDDEHMQILNLDGSLRITGAPLVSAEKVAENYDPETGWTLVEGTEATHYGKHTMAIDGNYTYVGGGQGANGENGLRVYAATGLVWQNGTNTTAVCVEGDYVYAATGAGLRVYEKYNGTDLPLYAYEVLNYDENGNAADVPGTNKPAAGTDAHSPNFVAVGEGYIFVACGQSGVYVFKLDTTVTPEKVNVSLQIPDMNYNQTQEVDDVEGAGAEFTLPAAPADKEDEYFAGYTDVENGSDPIYQPNDKVTVTTEDGNKTLYPVYKPYALIVTFDGNVPAGKELKADAPATIKSKDNSAVIPADVPAIEGMTFLGWSKKADVDPALVNDGIIPVLKADDKVEAEGDNNKVTLYAIWITNADASGTQGGEEQKPEPEPDNNGGGAGDPNNGSLN
ncbi:MAG: InlB B-repeat-containing protein, partial [Muribaculaceae bacterium]|nr:InlB B-repeat-containing protein [Muribaculaceae bacterium]